MQSSIGSGERTVVRSERVQLSDPTGLNSARAGPAVEIPNRGKSRTCCCLPRLRQCVSAILIMTTHINAKERCLESVSGVVFARKRVRSGQIFRKLTYSPKGEGWGGRRDLNPRQPDPQSGALTRLSYYHRQRTVKLGMGSRSVKLRFLCGACGCDWKWVRLPWQFWFGDSGPPQKVHG